MLRPGRRLPPHRPRPAARGDPGQIGGPGRRADARPRASSRFYELGRLSRLVEAAASRQRRRPGRAIAAAIAAHDPHCRGVLLLGLDAPEHELVAAFAMARRHPVCKGFAVGRTIFGPAGRGLAGRQDQRPAGDPGDGRRLSPADRRLGGRGMSELLLRHHAPDAGGLVHHVTPGSAGWDLCRLRALAAAAGPDACPGDRRARGLPGDRRRQGGHRGGRPVLAPASAIAPARSRARARARSTCPGSGRSEVTATSDLELAICWAPGGGSYPVRLIPPEAVTTSSRGTGHQRPPRARHPARERARRTPCSWSR